MSVTVVDGPPGSGKTSTIVAEAPARPGRTCVITYTVEAAETILLRSPTLTAGTIYKITWPLVRPFAVDFKRAAAPAAATHTRRAIRNEYDAALDEYTASAPSRRQRTIANEQAERLHAWDGAGPPPMDLSTVAVGPSATRYILPLARWHEAGRPGLQSFARFDTVYVDEAQDMGALEMATAAALVAPGGSLICYGDPGQALYAAAKGARGSVLPAAWQMLAVRKTLEEGHRCGDPLATIAARVLRPIWDRPASTFRAPHDTEVREWHPDTMPEFRKGALVLGYSRADVGRFIERAGLRDVALVPSLRNEARITVCTGHSAKGAQADEVYLLPWSKGGLERLDEQDPGAVRLLYTMLTRARARVFLPLPLLGRLGR